jgi:pilus assembly protein CpaF
VLRMEGDVITTQDLFTFEVGDVTSEGTVVGELRWSGLRPAFAPKLERKGVKLSGALHGSRKVLEMAPRTGS